MSASRIQRAEKHFFSSADSEGLESARRHKALELADLLRPHLRGNTARRALSIGSSFCLIESVLREALLPERSSSAPMSVFVRCGASPASRSRSS